MKKAELIKNLKEMRLYSNYNYCITHNSDDCLSGETCNILNNIRDRKLIKMLIASLEVINND